MDLNRNDFYKAPRHRIISYQLCDACAGECLGNRHPSGFPRGEKLEKAIAEAVRNYDFAGEERARLAALVEEGKKLDLAEKLDGIGSPGEAFETAEKALDRIRTLAGTPEMEERAMDISARACENKGRRDAREKLVRLKNHRSTLYGAESPEVADSLCRLGLVLEGSNAYSEAESSLKQALGIFRKTRTGDTEKAKEALIRVLCKQGKGQEALTYK